MNTGTFSDFDDLSLEERIIFQECCQNILSNIERNLDTKPDNTSQVSRLLSMRWYVSNELRPNLN
ncbi:MAG: hypothetical protein JXQ90_19665 [Cyclobacteriaceae bacterium]